jgi:transcriptional regulator
LQGTLEMMVLKTLSLEPMHGWGIAQRIQQMSRDVFLVSQGSLYPALIRMKRRGWLTTSWRVTANGRRARYYELTAAGRRQLGVEQASWQRASACRRLGHERPTGFRRRRTRMSMLSDLVERVARSSSAAATSASSPRSCGFTRRWMPSCSSAVD